MKIKNRLAVLLSAAAMIFGMSALPISAADKFYPVQVRPVESFDLKAGITYTVSFDYDIDVRAVPVPEDLPEEFQNENKVVYVRLNNMPKDSNVPVDDDIFVRFTTADKGNGIVEKGSCEMEYTPTMDGTVTLQLYLRNAVGTVTYSNLKMSVAADKYEQHRVARVEPDTYYTNLTSAVLLAHNDDVISLIRDASSSIRVTIVKNLTIRSDDPNNKKTVSSKFNGVPGMILVKNGKTAVIENVDIKYTENNKLTDKKAALATEGNGTRLTVKNAEITGDVYISHNNSCIELENVSLNGRAKTRKYIDTAQEISSKGNFKLTNSTVNELYFVCGNDTIEADSNSDIKSFSAVNVTANATVIKGIPVYGNAVTDNDVLQLIERDGNIVAVYREVSIPATALADNGTYTDGTNGFYVDIVPGANRNIKPSEVKWIVKDTDGNSAATAAAYDGISIGGEAVYTYGIVFERNTIDMEKLASVVFNYTETEGGN